MWNLDQKLQSVKIRDVLLFLTLIQPILTWNGPLGFGNFPIKSSGTESQKFFQMMSGVQLSLFDIQAMYTNVTRQEVTPSCNPGTCRTPIALWVISSLSPCEGIVKAGCPTGLVCCQITLPNLDDQVLEQSTIFENGLRRSDSHSQSHSETEWNEDEFSNSFQQDPIPGED